MKSNHLFTMKGYQVYSFVANKWMMVNFDNTLK